jgi:hypothetical protein
MFVVLQGPVDETWDVEQRLQRAMTVTVVSFVHKAPGTLVLSRDLPLLADTICDAATSGFGATSTRRCDLSML